MPYFSPPQFFHWNWGSEEVSDCWLLRQLFLINQIPAQYRFQNSDCWDWLYHLIRSCHPIYHKILDQSLITCDPKIVDCWESFYHLIISYPPIYHKILYPVTDCWDRFHYWIFVQSPIYHKTPDVSPISFDQNNSDSWYFFHHWILSQSPIYHKIPAQSSISCDH